MNPIKGYYSRFKGGFIFKYNPTEILNIGKQNQPEQTKVEIKTEQTAEEIADVIMDYSSDIIIELGLTHLNYASNTEYKSRLAEKISNIPITADVLDSIPFDDLRLILQGILADRIITEEDLQNASWV